MTREEKIISFAHELGFDLVRITSAATLPDAGAYFEKWLAEGNGADMDYLARDVSRRYTPKKILSSAQSVIMLGVNYYKKDHTFADGFRVAKYAQGRDYHKVITSKLKKFSKFLDEIILEISSENPASAISSTKNSKSAVDFGPLMERAFAAKSQMGFIGKNACIITREYGSYIFLAEIITTLELTPDKPTTWQGKCGSCTRCVDICPTRAIGPDRTIDSRRCISYLTIENHGAIPLALRPKIGNWLFGCDLCQGICPHNSRAKPTRVTDFQNISVGGADLANLSLAQILSIETDEQFLRLFAGTPFMRAKRRGLIRNACVVAGNLLRGPLDPRNTSATLGTPDSAELRALLQKLSRSDDAMIAEHAKWAAS